MTAGITRRCSALHACQCMMVHCRVQLLLPLQSGAAPDEDRRPVTAWGVPQLGTRGWLAAGGAEEAMRRLSSVLHPAHGG